MDTATKVTTKVFTVFTSMY